MKFLRFLLIVTSLGLSITSYAEVINNNSKPYEFKSGTWQGIIDGKPGEGAIFYRFEFKEHGSVLVTKQYGGYDNVVEHKQWKQIGNRIQIASENGAAITEFDKANLTLENENTIDYSFDGYEGKIKPYHQKLAWIHWILILVVLIVLNEIFRRSKWSTIIFFVLLPLILTPMVWSQQGVTYWFKWVKIYSVVFAVIWFTAIRYSNFGKYDIVKFIAALFLGVNIMEAVSQDFSMGHLPNILNGIAGVLSTITLFYGWKQITPDQSKEKDMVWPKMPVLWILAYDVWNIVYVYLNFPGSTSAQFMVLLSCTIPALFIKKGTWLQARAFTLAAWFMYYFTFPRFTEQLELMVPRDTSLMLAAAVLSIVLNVVYTLVLSKKLLNKRKA
jgi:hypothetical protein